MHEMKDLSLLSEMTFHSLYVEFECFVSDLVLAYINRDPSAYQSDLFDRVETSVRSKFDDWTASRPQCQQRSPLGLTRPPGGPTDDHATAL